MFWRKEKEVETKVLLPLYIYPEDDAWQPLFTAIEANPTTDFTIIINPNSGPGSTALPDEPYQVGITALNQYSNVTLVGYVSTDYTKRNLNLVNKDIQTYSKWSSGKGFGQHNFLSLQGIFLDETPNEWSFEAGKYFEVVAGVIRSLGDAPLIIHNPGTIPSPFFLPHTDLTVVFEGAYDTYKSKKLAADVSRFKKRTKVSRHKLALVVHSMSGTTGTKDYINVVKNMKKDVGTLFLTGLRMNYYERFEDNFGDWIEALN